MNTEGNIMKLKIVNLRLTKSMSIVEPASGFKKYDFP
jgi:hypothetical protein